MDKESSIYIEVKKERMLNLTHRQVRKSLDC